MKYLSNLHTHSIYCDGKNTLEETIKKAIEYGFISIGFSGHSYTDFDDCCCMTEDDTKKYISELKELKEKYKNKIEIYIGLEADYYSNIDKNKAKDMGLDYFIGSVHYLKDNNKYFTLDKSKETLSQIINHYGSAQKLVENYYSNIIDMSLRLSPDIIGHIDLVRKYNGDNLFFNENENWYIKCIDSVLEVIKKTNTIIEVNTNKVTINNPSMHYPSINMLKRILEKNIDITIDADAHSSERINYYFDEMVVILKNIGFKSVKMLKGGKFQSIEI